MNGSIRKEISAGQAVRVLGAVFKALVYAYSSFELSTPFLDLQMKAFFEDNPEVKRITFHACGGMEEIQFDKQAGALSFINRVLPNYVEEIIGSVNYENEVEPKYTCLKDIPLEDLEIEVAETINYHSPSAVLDLLYIPARAIYLRKECLKKSTAQLLKEVLKEAPVLELILLLLEAAPSLLESKEYLYLLRELNETFRPN